MAMSLYESRTVTTQAGSCLTLDYYLLNTDIQSISYYGIKVCSISKNSHQSVIYSEEVSKLTTSYAQISSLLSQCVTYLVTPTDLFTALDTLMTETF